ncbi:hypothetical protein ACIRRA_23800 [Nocardia sp. NPDC101769]
MKSLRHNDIRAIAGDAGRRRPARARPIGAARLREVDDLPRKDIR